MFDRIRKHVANSKGSSTYEIGEKYLTNEVAKKKGSWDSWIELSEIHGCTLLIDA